MLKISAKKLMAGLTLSVIMTAGLLMITAPAAAQDDDSYIFFKDSGLSTTGKEAGYDINSETGKSKTTVNDIIGNVIYAVLGLVGVIFFGFLIYGGITWMTAQGNEEQVKKATATVMNSLFGLIITLAAYAITYFLISYFWK